MIAYGVNAQPQGRGCGIQGAHAEHGGNTAEPRALSSASWNTKNTTPLLGLTASDVPPAALSARAASPTGCAHFHATNSERRECTCSQQAV